MSRLSSVPCLRRGLVVLACLFALVPCLRCGRVDVAAQEKKPAVKIKHYKGKVTPLADLLAKDGAQLDADAEPFWLALAGEDGKIHLLVKDGGSRLFFQDRELLNRPMRLTGRLLPHSSLLQVTAVHSYVKGELHEVYYWCDVCSIRRYEKTICECCGGPMVRHEEPVRSKN